MAMIKVGIGSKRASRMSPRRSFLEREIEDFLKAYNVRVNICDRSILNKFEIDMYLPDFNVAFEFNGIHFHYHTISGERTVNKKAKYHRNKTEECLNKGILLYHFWDYEHPQSIKRQIREILFEGLILSEKDADKNPKLLPNTVLVPMFYFNETVDNYCKHHVYTCVPNKVWKDNPGVIYKFYNSGVIYDAKM